MTESNTNIPSNEDIVNEITREVENSNIGSRTESLEETTSGVGNLNIEDNCDNSDSSPEDEFDKEIPDEQPPENLSEEELKSNHKEALKLKIDGNNEFKEEKYMESTKSYTKALKLCPVKYAEDRAILYANRAAAKSKLGRTKSAIQDCTKALELNDKYLRAYLRRAKLYEDTTKLDESLEDYKKILELDPRQKDALEAQVRLPPKINERNEALKAEMLGKLKDLGNLFLQPFGLSTNNFQINQDPNTGSYSINFKQN